MEQFRKAHEFTSTWEGGYVNNPHDIGGETNLGVTRRVWADWCKRKGLPVKPMRSLTPADVEPLYVAGYWEPVAAALPWPLSAAVYDMAVNHGPGNAAKFLAAARRAKPNGSPLEQALAACDAREAFYRAIVQARPSQGVFMKGWLRRVNAQRAWLKANAAPPAPARPAAPSGPPRVFMRAKPAADGTPGKTVLWDGKPTVYGGETVTAETVAQWATVYPPGASGEVGGIRISTFPDGALLLERR